MAIQVGGTTVINNSRALNNITSVDSTTAAAIGAAGVGGSTEWTVIGTYSDSTSRTGTYTSGATTCTMPNWSKLDALAVEWTFEVYHSSPDGYGGAVHCYVPYPPTTSNAMFFQIYNTFNSSQINQWHNENHSIHYPIITSYSVGANANSDDEEASWLYNGTYTSTKSSSSIMTPVARGGSQALQTDDFVPNATFNMYMHQYGQYMTTRNMTMQFLVKYA